MDCAVSLESRSDLRRVMYCAHPVSGTGTGSLMYCYNMKPVSTFSIYLPLYSPPEGLAVAGAVPV